jgi:hypothetical protein
MEQVLILALGAFQAAGEDQHRGVQAGGVGPAVRWGITTSKRRTLPAGCCASSNTGHGVLVGGHSGLGQVHIEGRYRVRQC